MPSITAASHVALTVRDMEASAEWYQRVFGWVPFRRFEAGEAGTPRILLFDAGSGFVVALCQPEDGAEGPFDHRRTGLDHLAFLVADQAALDEWTAHLEACGVEHSAAREVSPLGSLVSFEDPDGIQLELWVNAGS